MACSFTDERNLCGICLTEFTDPVTTSCEHNFCKVCIETCWENAELYLCPLCRKEFETKPELSINMALAKFVIDHMKMREKENKSNVLCDFCCENKLRAVKSCLQCVASFCETHLDSHKTSQRRMKHKLIDPVEILEDYFCGKHDKPLEFFCRNDQTFLCIFCTTTEHKTHDSVPIEQESSHRRVRVKSYKSLIFYAHVLFSFPSQQLLTLNCFFVAFHYCSQIQVEKKQTGVKMMIKERYKKIKQIKTLANVNKVQYHRRNT